MRYRDRGWLRGLFGQGIFKPETKSERVQEYTALNGSFADTSIGGNQAINPIPQFTRYADIKTYGYLARSPSGKIVADGQAGSYGMGRFYGENIDNNAHIAHFRFGVPKYIGALSFLTTMYNPDLARLTTDGMFSPFFRLAGSAAAVAGLFVVLGPAIAVGFFIGSKLTRMFLDSDASKYWYIKPTMHLYLQAVQSMLDNQLVHSRLVPFMSVLNSDTPDVQEPDSKLYDTMQGVYAGLPSIWKSNGKFDVFKMVNRYQILADMEASRLELIYKKSNGDPAKYNSAVEQYTNTASTDPEIQTRYNMDFASSGDKRVSVLEAITNAYVNSPLYQVDDKKDSEKATAADQMAKDLANANTSASNQVVADADKQKHDDAYNAALGESFIEENRRTGIQVTKIKDIVDDMTSSFKNSPWGGHFLAELHDGGQWISFRVDGKSSVSDSFGNSTVEPQIASVINGISSKARSIDMSASGGKTGFAPADAAIDAVKNFISGGLDVLNLSGIAGVFGKSSVDVPEMWDSSSADIATESYTIHLRSPFGNDISLFQNITVPLCFILAGCLPMSTGKQTYRNPFYCEVISRGRNTIRNGMITNVSITRGAGNMGWRPDGRMLGCDVTITVKDLSKVIAMPIIKDKRIFADDNSYTDYMATLGAASLHDLTYALAKLTINFNQWKQSWKSAFMAGNITNKIANGGPARLIAAFVTGTAKN